MKYTDTRKMHQDYFTLDNECRALLDAIFEDYKVSEDDYTALYRVYEKQTTVMNLLGVADDLCMLLTQMEDEKDRFNVQKLEKKYWEGFRRALDSNITIGRTWRFDDYRCIDYMKRWTEYLVNVRETIFG